MKHSSSLRAAIGTAALATAVAATAVAGMSPANAAAMPKFKQPTVFGTSFQPDTGHDFTKRISPRHDGILRGRVTYYAAGVAEYEPIRWVKDKTGHTEGYFVGPPEGDVRAYASRISPHVVFYSATGCKGMDLTANSKSLGTKRCSRSVLISRMKAGRPALITVYRGEIVKFQEIYTP